MKSEEHKKREERWKAEKDLEERKLLWDQEQKINVLQHLQHG